MTQRFRGSGGGENAEEVAGVITREETLELIVDVAGKADLSVPNE